MGEHFAHDLRQIGVIAASLAMGRPFRSIQQQHHQQHHQHHQHHHHHQQHHQEDDISTNLLNSVLAEVPVSGKLKHLIVRMVTARPAKGFGLQDVVAHPWFRFVIVFVVVGVVVVVVLSVWMPFMNKLLLMPLII